MAAALPGQMMWPLQKPFRLLVGLGVERALDLIGAPTKVETFLVGFTANTSLDHGMSVEPQRAPLKPDQLREVLDRALVNFEADPEQEIVRFPQELDDSRMNGVMLNARAEAIRQTIEASTALPGKAVFVSRSSPLGDYEVHTCVAIDRKMVDSVPAFERAIEDRLYVGRSLVHEVIADCLRRSDGALYLPNPGAGLVALGATSLEIGRAAAARFLDGCVMRTGGVPSELFERLEAITSLEYERSGAGGRLLIVGREHPVVVHGALARDVSLSDARGVRKLLEVSDPTAGLLSDGTKVFGVGEAESQESQPVFEVRVAAHATYELLHDDESLMRVAYGRPTLPRPLLDRSRFDDVLQRELDLSDTDDIWSIVEAASSGGHGTIVVVSQDASAEAHRLGGQATLLEPIAVTAADVHRYSKIDGAILIDVEGRCHAIGVILDGAANETGDPSRGSRFNSSTRYQASTKLGCVAVVVSDDGYVDLVPDLMPRVRRSDVEAAIGAFRAAVTESPVDGDLFAETHDAVLELGFYLDADMCEEVNELYELEQSRRRASIGIVMYEPLLSPDPRMNESFFLNEDTS